MSDELAELWAAFKEGAIAECGRHGAAELLDLAANVLRAEAAAERGNVVPFVKPGDAA